MALDATHTSPKTVIWFCCLCCLPAQEHQYRTAKEHQYLKQYLINTLDSLRNKYPDCGLVVMGDFNDFDVAGLLSNHSLKQVVQEPTRGTAKLDLIITNLHNL
jgi:hypothetical protein